MVRRITKLGIVAIALALVAARFGRSSGPVEVTETTVDEETVEEVETAAEETTEVEEVEE